MRALLAATLLLAAFTSHAEIEKFAQPDDTGLHLAWWPKVGPVPGWTHDHPASLAKGANLFVPNGQTFRDSPVVMYARAIYKPRLKETETLAQLIRDDQNNFREEVPGVTISADTAMKTADGRKLETYLFSPKKGGNWEVVAYGEEPEYFLIFTLSARDPASLKQARTAFAEMVGSYSGGS